MDVLLLKTVDRLGKEGQVVSVKDGYARNFLFSRGLAVPATDSLRNQVQAVQRNRQAQARILKERAAQLAGRLESVVWTVPMAVGAQGKLHGAVTAGDLVELLQREGVQVEKHQLLLEAPLTQLGDFSISAKLHSEITISLKVRVVPK